MCFKCTESTVEYLLILLYDWLQGIFLKFINTFEIIGVGSGSGWIRTFFPGLDLKVVAGSGSGTNHSRCTTLEIWLMEGVGESWEERKRKAEHENEKQKKKGVKM